MAETSDMRFLNTCRRNLDVYMAEPRWNPSNKALLIAALQAKLDGGYPIAEGVFAKIAPFDIVINRRQATYARIAPMVRASRRYLKSSGATDAEIADANTIINKILAPGSRKKETLDANNPAATIEKSNSTSHQSYDARYGNVLALRQFYGNVSAFAPNDAGIKLIDFDALAAACQADNQAVSTAYVEALGAWNKRDAELYKNDDSILEVFRLAKEYYKSLHDPKSPEYKAITASDMKLTGNTRAKI